LWALALGLPAYAANDFSRAAEDSAAKSPWPDADESARARSNGNLMKLDSSYQQALKFAPVLWFANPEQYFPTLPLGYLNAIFIAGARPEVWACGRMSSSNASRHLNCASPGWCLRKLPRSN